MMRLPFISWSCRRIRRSVLKLMASSLLLNGILMGHEHVGVAHNSTRVHTIVGNSNLSPKNDQGAMMTMRYVAKELRGPGYARSTAHRSLRLTPLFPLFLFLCCSLFTLWTLSSGRVSICCCSLRPRNLYLSGRKHHYGIWMYWMAGRKIDFMWR